MLSLAVTNINQLSGAETHALNQTAAKAFAKQALWSGHYSIPIKEKHCFFGGVRAIISTIDGK